MSVQHVAPSVVDAVRANSDENLCGGHTLVPQRLKCCSACGPGLFVDYGYMRYV